MKPELKISHVFKFSGLDFDNLSTSITIISKACNGHRTDEVLVTKLANKFQN